MKKLAAKYIILIFLLIISTGVLCGCASSCAFSKENVKLSSKKQMQKYVNAEFGKAEYLGKENGDCLIKYYYSDKQWGFTYYVESYASSLSVDGSNFGYKDSKSSNFTEEYYKFIQKKAEDDISNLGEQYFFYYKWSEKVYSKDTIGDVYFNQSGESENAAKVAKEINKILVNVDSRKYFETFSIYDADDKYLGIYKRNDDKYITELEEDIEFMMDKAEIICGKKVEYLYMEEVPIEEVPELSEHEICHIIGKPDVYEKVKKYYFKYKEKTYFICDILVDNMEFYSNYDKSSD